MKQVCEHVLFARVGLLVILFIVNSPEFFVSHRLPIAVAAMRSGFVVHVASPEGSAAQIIRSHGMVHHVISLSRSGTNPLTEIACFWSLLKLVKSVRPNIVHLVTLKPIVYGSLVSRLLGVGGVVAAFSGLGTVFVGGRRSFSIFKKLITVLLRIGLSGDAKHLIFQNRDDYRLVQSILGYDTSSVSIIKGSGVCLDAYRPSIEPEGVPIVTFASRILKDKGVLEFVAAASILRSRGVVARFWLAGSVDQENITSIPERKLDEWHRSGLVEVLGFQRDVESLFAQSNIIVLPSYREGLPKILIEAAACARPVVTTDVPGCRDSIVPNKTGLLVKAKDAEELANAIQVLVDNPEKRKSMGRAGRAWAESEFSIEKVVDAHLEIYSRFK